MVEFVACNARYQLKHKRYFILENCQTSKIWYVHRMQQLLSDPSVTRGDFHFCAYGLKDPESGLRSLKPTSLMHCLPCEAMRPIFRGARLLPVQKNTSVNPWHGCTLTSSARISRIILRHLQVKPLDNEVYLLEDIFGPFSNQQIDLLRKEMEDSLVQTFQKTVKQYAPGTEIEIFRQDPNDWRCQKMWNGCKKLRQL